MNKADRDMIFEAYTSKLQKKELDSKYVTAVQGLLNEKKTVKDVKDHKKADKKKAAKKGNPKLKVIKEQLESLSESVSQLRKLL